MEKFGLKSMKQLGYNVEFSPRHYTLMPKGTPKEIVAKVDEAFKKGSADPEFVAYLEKVGDFLAYKPGDEVLAEARKEYEMFGTLAKELGLIK